MAPVLNDYQQRSTNLRSKILKNEEQRIQLEQKLRYMSNKSLRSYQRKQIQHIQTYFTRLNQESQRAEQRNLQLLNDLTQAQQHLDKLHFDAQNLIRLKNDYMTYLESNYPNWQKPTSIRTSSNIDSSNEYDRLAQHMKQHQQDHLESDGNLRQSGKNLFLYKKKTNIFFVFILVPIVRQSYDVDSSMLFKHYEDQLKVGLDRTISPSTPIINNEQSISESNDIGNIFSRGIRNGSLRMELNRIGLYFLLDYIEKELKDTIDKKKFYRLDPPTITQTRTILDIANEQQKYALKDLDPTTTSMVILDQLPSTIRRTTINKCLLTEDILSSNIKDLDKDIIAQMLPEQDRSLWLRLIDHFTQLLKLHIMNCQTLVNKFAIAFLPANVFYTHDKAKSLLKHILEKLVGTQSSNSDDETSISKKQPIQHIVQTNTKSSSSWLKKLTNDSAFDDDDDDDNDQLTSSLTTKKINKSPRANINQDDSDHEFFT
jgi:hypothetical protein